MCDSWTMTIDRHVGLNCIEHHVLFHKLGKHDKDHSSILSETDPDLHYSALSINLANYNCDWFFFFFFRK